MIPRVELGADGPRDASPAAAPVVTAALAPERLLGINTNGGERYEERRGNARRQHLEGVLGMSCCLQFHLVMIRAPESLILRTLNQTWRIRGMLAVAPSPDLVRDPCCSY